METEIREFDQLTAQHMPSSAPGAGWKQSMDETALKTLLAHNAEKDWA